MPIKLPAIGWVPAVTTAALHRRDNLSAPAHDCSQLTVRTETGREQSISPRIKSFGPGVMKSRLLGTLKQTSRVAAHHHDADQGRAILACASTKP